MIISRILGTIILLLQQRQYLSEATALRASSYTTDKASIFNRNIEALYSTLGSSDDLDMIIGTAQLDTIYLVQVDAFDLVNHYKIKSNPELARRKAALRLQKSSKVMKSGYGELKVKVWDKDKLLAAQLANGIMDQLQKVHQGLLNQSNQSTLEGLKTRQQRLRLRMTDSTSGSPSSAALQKQIDQYEELIGEYELMVETKQPALLIVESARPAIKADKPRFLTVLLAITVLSFVFAFLLALISEKRKMLQLDKGV